MTESPPRNPTRVVTGGNFTVEEIHSSYESDSDDRYLMIKRASSRRKLPPGLRKENLDLFRTPERESISDPDIKTISILPNTTQKWRDDLPDPFQTTATLEFSHAYDFPVKPSDAWKTTAGDSALFGRKCEPEEVLEAITETIEGLDVPKDITFKEHDQSVTAVPVNLISSFSREAPARLRWYHKPHLVKRRTRQKLCHQKTTTNIWRIAQPSVGNRVFSCQQTLNPLLLGSLALHKTA
jgi:hypothetical protein